MEQRKARMATLVADGVGPSAAGTLMGLTKGQAAHVWRSIKADLGRQAS